MGVTWPHLLHLARLWWSFRLYCSLVSGNQMTAYPKRHPASIRVLFVCNGCGQTYMAIQERTKGAGRFECAGCRYPVYSWSGSYDYTVWTPVEMGGSGTLQ